MDANPPAEPPRKRPPWDWPRLLIVLWVGVGALLLLFLNRPPVNRTQEARVLEVAREMVAGGDWLIPHLNGKLRLQKPPLAYWASALSYEVFGVSRWSGRLPGAIAAWLTIGLVFLIALRLFSPRAAWLSAGMLASSTMFVRYGSVAETDVWTALFVTLGSWAFWQVHDSARATVPRRGWLGWSYVAAASVALATLAKGPPALYPLLFFIGIEAIHASGRRWRGLGRWLISGAPLAIVALAAPWFIYVSRTVGWHVFQQELAIAASGAGHRGTFLQYIPDGLVATLPWAIFTVVGLVAAVGPARRDARLKHLWIWLAAIVIPLCLAGQKQRHYLMPLLPVLMIFAGSAADRGLAAWRARGALADSAVPKADLPLAQWVRVSMMLTAAGVAAAGVAIPIIGRRGRGTIDALDIALGAAMALSGAWALAAMLRNRDERALTGAVVLSVPLVTIALGAWMPTFMPINAATVAAEVRRDFGSAPVAFYQGVDNAAMVFEMQRVMPQYHSPADLPSATTRQPDLVLISWGVPEAPAPPPGYAAHATRKVEDRYVQIYRPIAASAGTGPGAQHEPDERAGQ